MHEKEIIKKKLGTISSIKVFQNNKNNGKPKENPWFANQPSNNNNIKHDNKDGEEKKLVKFFGAI